MSFGPAPCTEWSAIARLAQEGTFLIIINILMKKKSIQDLKGKTLESAQVKTVRGGLIVIEDIIPL